MTGNIIALIFVVFCWIATYILCLIAVRKYLKEACFNTWYYGKKFIYSNDSEIETYVNDILKQRSEERKEKERIYKENLEKREREELTRLKAKYGE